MVIPRVDPPTLTYKVLLSFSQALAEQLTRLVTTPGLATKLREAGKETVSSRFLSQRMVDEIEDYLVDVTITSR